MRRRYVVLAGTGFTGGFLLILGMLTKEGPPQQGLLYAAPRGPPAELAPRALTMGPWQMAERSADPLVPSAARASAPQPVYTAAPASQAGVWSAPAEFAPPE